MAIIATAFIAMKVNKHTVEIIKAEVNKCGCVSAGTLAIHTRKPVDEIKEALKMLVGEKEVACNSDRTICCTDKIKLDSFVAKMNTLKEKGKGSEKR